MTRAQTLLLSLLAMHVLLGAVCIAVARGERQSRALHLWGWGLLAYALGALITIDQWLLPYSVKQVVGNSLITLAAGVTAAGGVSHTTFRFNRVWTTAGFFAIVAWLVVNHLGEHQRIVDVGAPTVFSTTTYLIATLALFRWPPADAKTAARFLAVSFVLAVAVWDVRLWAVWRALGASAADQTDLMISLFAIAQLLCLVASTLGLLWIEVRKMEASLERVAYFDSLTALPNRRAMMLRFQEELARAKRQKIGFAIALFDIDHFKHFNDTHGHLIGDAVLKHVADVLGRTKRDEDILGRVGGEEFLVILPNQDATRALDAANRLRAALAAAPFDAAGRVLTVTLSGGVASQGDDGSDWDQLFTAADRRLYDAKRAGRNRVAGNDLVEPGPAAIPALA